MRFYRSNLVFQFLFQKCVWKRKPNNKWVYLTFDDGPTPDATPYVLDLLEEYGAKASFFCVGENVEKHPELFSTVVKKGHLVGNHTYSHYSAWKVSQKRWLADFAKAEKLIDSNWMRPPYGLLTWPLQHNLVKRGYHIAMWDFITYDFDPMALPQVAMAKLQNLRSISPILVMHDQPKALPNLKVLLPMVLDHYAQAGYRFVRLDEPY